MRVRDPAKGSTLGECKGRICNETSEIEVKCTENIMRSLEKVENFNLLEGGGVHPSHLLTFAGPGESFTCFRGTIWNFVCGGDLWNGLSRIIHEVCCHYD